MKLASRIITGALLLAAPAAFAQGTVAVSIYQALALTQTAGMSFGNLAAGLTAGSATIAAAAGGTVSPGGGVTVASGGSPSGATFTVSGTDTNQVNISIPIGASPVAMSGPSMGTMTAGNFTCSATGSGAPGSGNGGHVTLSGATAFAVGATLNIGANQTQGSYNGTFSVTVLYN
jgi:Domain of unknown function (DUF4402)